MAGNSFGTKFKVTAFGESHGNALGVVVDGVPAGIKIDSDKIQNALDRRRPGVSTNGSGLVNSAVTGRKENDRAEILSGIFNGFSTGTPISIIIRNENQHSSDYNELAVKMRPGHADFTYMQKYGFRDYRGGGRSSGRETCTRVAAGEIARQVIESKLNGNFSCTAYTLRAAGIQCSKIDLSEIEKNTIGQPSIYMLPSCALEHSDMCYSTIAIPFLIRSYKLHHLVRVLVQRKCSPLRLQEKRQQLPDPLADRFYKRSLKQVQIPIHVPCVYL